MVVFHVFRYFMKGSLQIQAIFQLPALSLHLQFHLFSLLLISMLHWSLQLKCRRRWCPLTE